MYHTYLQSSFKASGFKDNDIVYQVYVNLLACTAKYKILWMENVLNKSKDI